MKKYFLPFNIIKYLCALIFLFSIFNFTFAQAASSTNSGIQGGIGNFILNLDPIAADAGYSTADNVSSIEVVIGRLIKLVISFLGILFLILIIVSGLQWMFAGGNEDVVDKSKQRIKNATFGLAIVLAAYAITFFVVDLIIGKTGFSN